MCECMQKARDVLDAYATVRWRTPARAAGRWVGIGFATYIELTGVGSAIPVSPGMPIATGTEAAFLRVDPAGTVTATFSVAPRAGPRDRAGPGGGGRAGRFP